MSKVLHKISFHIFIKLRNENFHRDSWDMKFEKTIHETQFSYSQEKSFASFSLFFSFKCRIQFNSKSDCYYVRHIREEYILYLANKDFSFQSIHFSFIAVYSSYSGINKFLERWFSRGNGVLFVLVSRCFGTRIKTWFIWSNVNY